MAFITAEQNEKLMELQGSAQELADLLDELFDASEDDVDHEDDELMQHLDTGRDAAQASADAAGEVMALAVVALENN